MSKLISIYFAGSIQKGSEKNEFEWSSESINELAVALQPYQLVSLNPSERTDDLSDSLSVFGRDMTQVYAADMVFVDLRAKRGIGVGAEMMWAKFHKRPVIGWAPKNTHYQRDKTIMLGQEISGYVHPFVAGLCDTLVSSMKEAADWIKDHMSNAQGIKGIHTISSYMTKYRTEQFEKDIPMKQIVQRSVELKRRVLTADELH